MIPRLSLIALAGLLAAAPALAADGEAVFRKTCATCHGVASAGIKAKIRAGDDLGGLAGRTDARALRELATATNTAGRRHQPFTGSDEELDAMIAWLLEQPAE